VGRVIALANQKGGVAKTTSTLNLAVAFAEEGNKVLAIDLDPQGNLTMSQGLNPDTIERSMYDVLVHRLPIEQIIHQGEIDLAVASIDLAGAELALSAMIGRERSLEKALRPVLDEYDFVVIDTPPSLGLLTINALVAANGVIVPVQCEYLSLRGLVQLENTLSMIRENLNPDVGIEGILATMYDSRTLHSREALEILEENFGDLVSRPDPQDHPLCRGAREGDVCARYDPTGTRCAGLPTWRRRCSRHARMRRGRSRSLPRDGAAQRVAVQAPQVDPARSRSPSRSSRSPSAAGGRGTDPAVEVPRRRARPGPRRGRPSRRSVPRPAWSTPPEQPPRLWGAGRLRVPGRHPRRRRVEGPGTRSTG
jgi:chromosome partitioning protein